MKQFLKGITFVAGLVVLAACGGKSEASKESTEKKTYSYNHENSIMEWTAFKFVSKAPVKGTFNKIVVSSISEADNVKTLAESFGFTIPVNSIETQDESRNAKIVQFFFGTMQTTELTGRIVQLKEDGSAELEVTMNGITGIVKGTYEIVDANFAFKATMDISKWNSDKAIAVLNENCKENHTENGVTKVWSEVDLSFTTKLNVK
jgi:hypothetical protein